MGYKKLDEYNKKYGEIPKDFYDRFLYLMSDININKSDITKLKKEIKRALRVNTESITFIFYFTPQATPRARYSRFTKAFYVKNVLNYNEVFGKFIKDCEDIDFKITTPCEFKCITYFPVPNNMSKVDKLLAELRLIKHVSKPDWDNLGKTYSDMIQKHLLIDDALIYKGTTEKYYSIKPRIEITIDFMTDYDSSYNKNKIKKWSSYKDEQ